jgi:hypothetical protein
VTEQQPFEAVGRWGSIEIRRYPSHAIAEVVLDGDFDHAANRGFRALFGYIQGQVAMTAPVVQTPERDRHRVAFVMPAGRQADSLPAPADSRVQLRDVPPHLAAALRFAGRGNARDLESRGRLLREALAASPWRPVGPVRLARFTAPFVPPLLRHNEVVVPVAERRAGC